MTQQGSPEEPLPTTEAQPKFQPPNERHPHRKDNCFMIVRRILNEHLGVSEDKIKLNSNLVDDLGIDSLDAVELVMAFEEVFGVEISKGESETLTTVGDIVSYFGQRRACLP